MVASKKLKVKVLPSGEDAGLHAWLITCAAVVSEDEAVGAVEMEHGDHVLGAMVAMDFAHERGATRGVAESNLHWRALGVLPFPGAGERLELVEGFLRAVCANATDAVNSRRERARRSDFMLAISF